MNFDIAANRRLRELLADAPTLIQRGDCYGLERESLRVRPDGQLALSPHPEGLGSSLTNRYITTDFSESQLEFTTSPYRNFAGLLRELRYLQIFTLDTLARTGDGQEGLWPLSMPSALPAEAEIPIAEYGTSELARYKHVYRQGLARRYGRRMQTVSGVHFNFSFSRRFFQALAASMPGAGSPGSIGETELQNEVYFAMIRNFQRDSLFLMYLFGASPAIDRSFLGRPDHRLRTADFDARTLEAPFATSLRLSDIGYTNSNQCELAISFDSLSEYIRTLCHAVSTPNPAYASYSVERGEQLNDHYLQIENEHYGVIRPKQLPRPGERPLTALEERGVRYLEVRGLDIDPYDPGGVSEERITFAHLMLIHSLVSESPPLSRADCALQRDNEVLVAWRGREPDLKVRLRADDHRIYNLREAGLAWVDRLSDLAERLDREIGCERYVKTLEQQREKFRDSELTPSARVLRDMHEARAGHVDFGLELLERHRRTLAAQTLPGPVRRKLEAAVSESVRTRLIIETESPSASQAAPVLAPGVCSG